MSADAAISRERQDAFDAGHRTLSSITPILLLFVAIPVATRVPIIQSFLELPTVFALLATVPMLAVTLAATFAFARLGGASPIYRATEQLETLTIQLGTAGLILASGGGRSFFWFCYLVHAMLCGFSGLSPRLVRVAVTVAPLAAAVGFVWWKNDVEAAVIAIANTVLGMFLVFAGQSTHRRISELSAERDRLRGELLAMQVDQERTRIARDLHDGVAAELTALSARLDAVELEEEDPTQRAFVDALKLRARGSIDELRAVVWQLRAPERSFAELTSYAESTARALCPKHVTLHFEVDPEDDDTPLPGRVGLHALRIMLELVRNAVTHGAPSSIRISAKRSKTLELSVTDDGRGVDPASLAELRSRSVGGLANIRARARELGGETSLDSPGGGFTVRVCWPLSTDPDRGA